MDYYDHSNTWLKVIKPRRKANRKTKQYKKEKRNIEFQLRDMETSVEMETTKIGEINHVVWRD